MMAGRRQGRRRKSQKTRLLSEIIEAIDRVPCQDKVKRQIEYYECPPELLEIIISKLTLRDNIRASAVCKVWRNAAIFVRISDKPPFLIICPKYGNLYEFYDPCKRKSYWLDLLELRGSCIRCAKDGWLLVHKPNTQLAFLFSPYTRELIKLPDIDLRTHVVAISGSPTSPSCVVFAFKNSGPSIITLSMWRPEKTEWSIWSHDTGSPFRYSAWNKTVFYNGVFYCLSTNGTLGMYKTATGSWSFHNCPVIRTLNNFFLGVHNDDIYLIITFARNTPAILKLELPITRWGKINTLGGMTLFLNCWSSVIRTDLLGDMRDKLYFSKVMFNGKHCVSYSVNERRYYPLNELYNSRQRDITRSIWIEQPEKISCFL